MPYFSNSLPWVMKNRNSAAVRPKVLKFTQASVLIMRQITSLATARTAKNRVIRRVRIIQPSGCIGRASSITSFR